jgi:hypothetical protein
MPASIAAAAMGPSGVSTMDRTTMAFDRLETSATGWWLVLMKPMLPGGVPYQVLTDCHTERMFSHMKTTLNIDDTVFSRLKQEAARQGKTMSELVETGLRLLFRAGKDAHDLPALPAFRSGGHLVDVANRDALYDVLESRK